MLRSILHCDMNNFYASVECMLDPALKKYPIAVCGSVEERHGIVLAKNYKAKITELEDAIHSLDVQMEPFEEISLIGVEVTQKTYGNGTVIAQEGSKITVQFPAKTTAYFINKQYTMRPRFENDEEIVEAFTELDNLKAQKAKLEKELEQL